VEVAQGIAVGDICPISHKTMEDLVPSYQPSKRKALPLDDGKLGLPQKTIDSFFSESLLISTVYDVSSGLSQRSNLPSRNLLQ
jgi:hypothetical protein